MKNESEELLLKQLDNTKGIDKRDPKGLLREELVEKVSEIKQLCINLNIPVFMSLCMRTQDGENTYYNDCVLAELSNPPRGSRISQLILAVNGADVNHPDYIQRHMVELSNYLDSLSLTNREAVTDTFGETLHGDLYGIAKGSLITSVPSALYGAENAVFDDMLDDDND